MNVGMYECVCVCVTMYVSMLIFDYDRLYGYEMKFAFTKVLHVKS